MLHEASDRELRSVSRELAYYRWLGRHLKDWRGVPRFFGTVETNRGRGYVYECVRDFDGKLSETMTARYKEPDESRAEEFADVVGKMSRYLLENGIIPGTLNPDNIAIRRLDEKTVFPVFCDNIGPAGIWRYALWLPGLCRARKIRPPLEAFLRKDYVTSRLKGAR